MKQVTKKTMRILSFFIIATIMIMTSRITVYAHADYEYKLADEQIQILQDEYNEFQVNYVNVHSDYLDLEDMPSDEAYLNAVSLHDDVTAYWELQAYKNSVVEASNINMQAAFDKLVLDYYALNSNNVSWNEMEKNDISTKKKAIDMIINNKVIITPSEITDLQIAISDLKTIINVANNRVNGEIKQQEEKRQEEQRLEETRKLEEQRKEQNTNVYDGTDEEVPTWNGGCDKAGCWTPPEPITPITW